jgi:serine/threonine protein kinase
LLARVLGQRGGAEAAAAWATTAQVAEPPGPGASAEAATRRVGEFELLSRLGQGGMGVVHRAWQPSLGRQVALKCMLRAGDPKAEARFAREIRALGRIEHPNVVKVFTSGAEGDQWFYAMELIEGTELARATPAPSRSWPRGRSIAARTCTAWASRSGSC